MPTIRRRIELSAPIAELWPLLQDALADDSDLEESLGLPIQLKGNRPDIDSVASGDTYSAVVTLMGMVNTVDFIVQEMNTQDEILANKRGNFKVMGTGMAGVTVDAGIDLEEAADAKTVMLVEMAFEGQMLVGAIGNAVEAAVQELISDVSGKLTTRFPGVSAVVEAV